MSLPTFLRQRRFELFYASLVLCGLAVVAGSLPSVLAASSPADVPWIPVALVLSGLGLAITSSWEAVHRERADWAEAVAGRNWTVVVVVGAGVVVAAGAAYWLLGAV